MAERARRDIRYPSPEFERFARYVGYEPAREDERQIWRPSEPKDYLVIAAGMIVIAAGWTAWFAGYRDAGWLSSIAAGLVLGGFFFIVGPEIRQQYRIRVERKPQRLPPAPPEDDHPFETPDVDDPTPG